ncbi:hypothetical protein [Nannocystis exedens]|uniref:hypothetical protein n=1 Tax=Nannocystis exedens TaxID=54 RepID=UPI001160E144|nr:hypothetical protein [Nannocystis exedens]
MPPPRQLTPEQIEALVEACNYKTTFEHNTGLVCPVGPGYSEAEPEVDDPFAPTEACREQLFELWNWESTWFLTKDDLVPQLAAQHPEMTTAEIDALATSKAANYAEELKNTVSGLHALFFHPLFVPADEALFFADELYPEGWAESFAVAELPAAGSFVLDENDYNREFLLHFYSSISQINAYDEVQEVTWRMEWAELQNAVIVERGFVREPNAVEADVAAKYFIAPSFAHELGHAMGEPEHNDAFETTGDEPDEDDDAEDDDEYGDAFTYGAALAQAMLLGAAYSRMPGKSAYLGDWDVPLGYIDMLECKFFHEQVDPITLGHVPAECESPTMTPFATAVLARPPANPTAGEQPCRVDEVAAEATEISIASDGMGGLTVTVPRWVLGYVEARLDDFVLDATTHSTTVTVDGEPFQGFAIDWLHADGFAAHFGLEEGDVVYVVDGYPATDVSAVLRGVDALTASGSAAIRILRGGAVVTIVYVLAP